MYEYIRIATVVNTIQTVNSPMYEYIRIATVGNTIQTVNSPMYDIHSRSVNGREQPTDSQLPHCMISTLPTMPARHKSNIFLIYSGKMFFSPPTDLSELYSAADLSFTLCFLFSSRKIFVQRVFVCKWCATYQTHALGVASISRQTENTALKEKMESF